MHQAAKRVQSPWPKAQADAEARAAPAQRTAAVPDAQDAAAWPLTILRQMAGPNHRPAADARANPAITRAPPAAELASPATSSAD